MPLAIRRAISVGLEFQSPPDTIRRTSMTHARSS
jgi:hypothetical protein